MALTFALVAAGIGLLWKGADWLVDGASSIARRMKIAPIVIGLTIVAFGTSMPELVVNVIAVIGNAPEIAIGNILGSNIANILLILGIAAVITPLAIHSNTVWKEIPLALLSVALVYVMASDWLVGRGVNSLDAIDGMVLLCFFVVFLYYTFGISKVDAGDGIEQPELLSVWKSLGYVVAGLVGLMLGGKFTVDGAVTIAEFFGLSQRFISVTVVAVGTSLPELVTSAVAALKKESDIAVGNVVGSNIFNVFFILGVSSVMRPLPFSAANASDALVAVGAAALLFVAMFVGKRHMMERWQGWMFLACYVAYVGALLMTV